MSCVTVQLGQCGNQLGCVLNDTLFTHLAGDKNESGESGKRRQRRLALERYFTRAEPTNDSSLGADNPERFYARSVLVDMETKVVQKCMQHVGTVGKQSTSAMQVKAKEEKKRRQINMARKKTRTSRGARGGARNLLKSTTTLEEASLPISSSSMDTSSWSYRPNAAFVRHSGSGNNWAAGYNTHADGPHGAGNKVMGIIRMEAEQSDFGVRSFLLLQSLAGGTGSGVGARVSELLRDEYGNRSTIANALVAPYSAGEVSVQLYNSLLTLTHTSPSSDAVFVFRNDQIQSICQTRMRLTHPSFEDLNSVIAGHLASSVLLPSTSWSTTQSGATNSGLEDAVRHLCAHPSYRMLGIKMLPVGAAGDQRFDTSTWKGMLRRLHQMQMDPDAYMEDCIDWSLSSGTTSSRSSTTSSTSSVPEANTPPVRLGSLGVNRTLAATLVLRGIDAMTTLEPEQSNRDKTKEGIEDRNGQERFRYPPSNWSKTPGMFLTHLLPSSASPLDVRTDGHSYNFWERSASIVSNSQTIVTPLRRILENGREMFEANAYVHQYETHGFQRDDLNEAFEQMSQIVHDYSNI